MIHTARTFSRNPRAVWIILHRVFPKERFSLHTAGRNEIRFLIIRSFRRSVYDVDVGFVSVVLNSL